jgi:hypothetical protein
MILSSLEEMACTIAGDSPMLVERGILDMEQHQYGLDQERQVLG